LVFIETLFPQSPEFVAIYEYWAMTQQVIYQVSIYNSFRNLKFCWYVLLLCQDPINWTYTILLLLFDNLSLYEFWVCSYIPVLGHDPTSHISSEHLQFLLLLFIVIFFLNLKFCCYIPLLGQDPINWTYTIAIYWNFFYKILSL
jgi:hypothetical protein